VSDANFSPDRLDKLQSRLSAAYKGINMLVLREGKTSSGGAEIEADQEDIALDIPHLSGRVVRGQEQEPIIINKTPHLLRPTQDRRACAVGVPPQIREERPCNSVTGHGRHVANHGICWHCGAVMTFEGSTTKLRKLALLGLISRDHGKHVTSHQ
jgi:hypothetical protein